MKLKYSFLCNAANFSQSGNLNVLDIFHTINSQKFPFKYPKFVYVACIKFHLSEIGKHNFKVSFVDEDGKEIIPPLKGEIHANPNKTSTIMLELRNISFSKPGTYQIDLVIDNLLVTSDDVNVVQINQNQK